MHALTHTHTHTLTCTSQVQKVFGGGGAGLLSPIHGQGLNLDPTDWIHRQPNILLCAWTQNSHTCQSWLFFTYFSRSGIKSIIQVLSTLNTYVYTRTGMHASPHTHMKNLPNCQRFLVIINLELSKSKLTVNEYIISDLLGVFLQNLIMFNSQGNFQLN